MNFFPRDRISTSFLCRRKLERFTTDFGSSEFGMNAFVGGLESSVRQM